MNTPYSPGLEGVTAGITAISNVDAERNQLIYRGYDIRDLVEHCAIDEVAYLLLFGKLPDISEYADFQKRVRENRDIPSEIYDLYRQFHSDAHPMDTLRAAVAVLAILDPERHLTTREARINQAVRLYAKIPALVVNGYRISRGEQPIPPDPTLDHNTNFFCMLTGKPPSDLFARVFNVTQILYAEHSFNASTFSARVTVSTLSDLFSGVVSAIGTLKGPLHGGANEEAMRMLLEIADPGKASAWVRDALVQKKKIMGFGHREYKHGDERAKIVKLYGHQLAEATGNTRWRDISQIVEDEMLAQKRLYPNVDFPVASAYYLMGIPIELYTPIFVMSRITGWSAHIIEQLDNNRLMRPQSEYNGPQGLKVTPISERE